MNQKQVNQFFKAVRALDRLHGGTGDNSLSGLQRAVDLSHARESAREATVKLGRAAFGGWEHTFESRPEYKAAAEEGVQEGLTILAKRKAAEEKAKADFQKDVEEAAYFKSPAFREEVISELIAEGATRLQAEGRTRDQARTFAEAQRLNLI